MPFFFFHMRRITLGTKACGCWDLKADLLETAFARNQEECILGGLRRAPLLPAGELVPCGVWGREKCQAGVEEGMAHV